MSKKTKGEIMAKEKLFTIEELLSKLRLNQTQFAEQNDISFQSVNKWINGKSTPSMNRCEKLESKYGIKLVYRR